jgi:predicted nucleic acid-binding protein
MSLLVSNTGPLIALSAIDALDLLPRLYERVVIPEEVRKELNAAPHGIMRFPFAETTGWLAVQQVSVTVDPLLSTVLDVGEAAVIQLARHLRADAVLIDERKVRKVARSVYQLNVIGTVRVLVDAKRKGLLSSVGSALEEIRRNGYWIHDAIVQRALQKAGE